MKKTGHVTKDYIVNAPLPHHGDSYTVISHADVINKVKRIINENGFEIEHELYKCNTDAQIANGIYHIKSDLDPEMGMMFAWVNSYNKMRRFRCAVGSYVTVCMNGMISGDLSSYGRKHTGDADVEYAQVIKDQLQQLSAHHKRLVADKNMMKNIEVTKRRQTELLGRMYLHDNIINSVQLNIIKEQLAKPDYDYNASEDSVWALYNHVTHAIKDTHPFKWMDAQRNVHNFFTAEYSSYMRPAAADLVLKSEGGYFEL